MCEGREMRRFLDLAVCTLALGFALACGGEITDVDPDRSGADAGSADSGLYDSGVIDSERPDAGAGDSGVGDSGTSDSGVSDAGEGDAGPSDSGLADAGEIDAGLPDSGVADAGMESCAERLGSAYEDVETRCDGIDNDCDGLTDIRRPTLVIASQPSSEVTGWNHPEFFSSPSGYLLVGPYPRFIELDAHGRPTGVVADFRDAGFASSAQYRPHVARYGDQLTLLQGLYTSPPTAWRIDVDDRLQQLQGSDGGVRAFLVGTNALGGGASGYANVMSDDGTRALHIFGDQPWNHMWLAATWSDGGVAVPPQPITSDAGALAFYEAYAVDGGFVILGGKNGDELLRHLDLDLAQVGPDEMLSPLYPYRACSGFLSQPGTEPALIMHNQYPPELAIWRAPYTPATWSEWYDELAYQGLRRGLIAYTEDPPLAVAMTASNPGQDGGSTRLTAATLDGGRRVLLSGPEVGLLYPDVINTDAGTFLVSFEYLPQDGGTTGIYTMEICAP